MRESTKTEQRERESSDTLTELRRAGARKLIAQALEAEIAGLLATYVDQQDVQGRTVVVCNGYELGRDIQTGIGPVTVQVPKVPSRQGVTVTFRSAYLVWICSWSSFFKNRAKGLLINLGRDLSLCGGGQYC